MLNTYSACSLMGKTLDSNGDDSGMVPEQNFEFFLKIWQKTSRIVFLRIY